MSEQPTTAPDPRQDWIRQLRSDEVVATMIAAALKAGRGASVVLRMDRAGKVLKPKANVGD